jgi:hypothetical protein
MRAPIAERFDWRPSSRTASQWLPKLGFSKSALWNLSERVGAAHLREDVEVAVGVEIGEGDGVPLLEGCPSPLGIVTSA